RYETGSHTANPFADLSDLGGNGGGFGNLEEFLRSVMEGRSPGAARSQSRAGSAAPAEDMDFGVDITLEEAGRGVAKRVNLTMEDVCPDCGGSGHARNNRGQFDLSRGVCPKCRGQGRVDVTRSLTVKIPAGAWDGYTIILPGQGPADARGRRGDLYARV